MVSKSNIKRRLGGLESSADSNDPGPHVFLWTFSEVHDGLSDAMVVDREANPRGGGMQTYVNDDAREYRARLDAALDEFEAETERRPAVDDILTRLSMRRRNKPGEWGEVNVGAYFDVPMSEDDVAYRPSRTIRIS